MTDVGFNSQVIIPFATNVMLIFRAIIRHHSEIDCEKIPLRFNLRAIFSNHCYFIIHPHQSVRRIAHSGLRIDRDDDDDQIYQLYLKQKMLI